MPPLYVAILLIDIALCVHVARTHRPMAWIFVILLFPVVGAIAYVVAELLGGAGIGSARPSKEHVLGARGTSRSAPRDVLEQRLAQNDTFENRMAVAHACLADRSYERAAAMYAACLTGREGNPALLLGLAQAHFGLGKYAAARRTLDELIRANPDFESPTGHLLYARTLEALREHDAALAEYDALDATYPGEEARYRHGSLLAELGRADDARRVFERVLDNDRRAPDTYRMREQIWIDQSRAALQHMRV